MANSFERFERNLDRIEKFFLPKRRKPSSLEDPTSAHSRSSTPPARSGSLDQPTGSDGDLLFQTFPSPSFIRPKSNRMLARDEVAMSPNSNHRAQSLPGPPSIRNRSSVASSAYATASSYSRILDQFPGIPLRTSSMRTSSLQTASFRELLDFSFSEKPRRSADDSVWSSRSPSRSPSRSRSRSRTSSMSPRSEKRRKERPLYQLRGGNTVLDTQRPDTPPPSAKEEKFLPSTPPQLNKTLPPVPTNGNPTPEPSPRLVPQVVEAPESTNGEVKSKPRRWRSLGGPVRPAKVFEGTLSRSQSDSHASGARNAARTNRILKEPSVNDFLSLSDDDIADGRPITPTPPPASIPVSPPPHHSKRPLLTLPPPLSTRPATAAAFEAARIASRYNFDLVYVVNLWPNHISCSQLLSTQGSLASLESPTSLSIPSNALRDFDALDSGKEGQGPLARISPRSGMTGRLLAAYGLSGVVSPFRISAPVHLKVLRSAGWLEFRRENAAMDEFARGYSCAFYPGFSPEGTWRPVSPQNSGNTGKEQDKKPKAKLANRGLVFAAYRLPRADGTTLGSSEDELTALYQDAETLVEMLIDIHVAQRWRRAVPQSEVDPNESQNQTRTNSPLLAG